MAKHWPTTGQCWYAVNKINANQGVQTTFMQSPGPQKWPSSGQLVASVGTPSTKFTLTDSFAPVSIDHRECAFIAANRCAENITTLPSICTS